jgi:hypothetical protein
MEMWISKLNEELNDLFEGHDGEEELYLLALTTR